MTTDNAAGLAGHEDPGAEAGTATQPDPGTEDVLEALRDVVDPELGVNVVDLGLVYGVTVTEGRSLHTGPAGEFRDRAVAARHVAALWLACGGWAGFAATGSGSCWCDARAEGLPAACRVLWR
jgi:hypothetical protein